MGDTLKAMLHNPDDDKTMLVKELRCAERNVEVLANLCDYLSTKVSEFSRNCALDTLHHIQYLHRYYLDPEHHEYGARWVYQRPLVWRDRARYEDDTHRLEEDLRRKQEIMQIISTVYPEPRLGPQLETEEQRKERDRQIDEMIKATGKKFAEEKQ